MHCKCLLGYKAQRTSYDFANGQSLALNNVDFVQLTRKWIRIFLDENRSFSKQPIFKRKNGSDITQSNGFANSGH
jgi:hypothetical protein